MTDLRKLLAGAMEWPWSRPEVAPLILDVLDAARELRRVSRDTRTGRTQWTVDCALATDALNAALVALDAHLEASKPK